VALLAFSTLTVWAALASPCLATGDYGPSGFFPQGQQRLAASPEFYWKRELHRFAKEFSPPEKFRALPTSDSPHAMDENPRARLAKSTSDADVEDFARAIREGRIKPPNPDEATRLHAAARAAIAAPSEATPDLPTGEFPSEFADYHRGAMAYALGQASWAKAREAWKSLLARPAGERRDRSVWAAFMLGKLAMKSGDYPTAIEWFRKTRELAREGFADSMGMAADSYGWEGRCEWKLDHPDKAAKLFLTQFALGDESAIVSLKALIPDRSPTEGMLNYGPEPDDVAAWSAQQKAEAEQKALAGLNAAAADPLLRRLVTAHILATEAGWTGGDGSSTQLRCTRWLQAVQAAKPSSIEDAEYLGWVAYTAGNYGEAARWLSLAKPDSPAACWLRAKLELRDGRLEESAKSMGAAWRAIIASDPGFADFEGTSGGGTFSFPAAASGEYGLLSLARGDFVQSLDILLKGGLWDDAAFVAERILTTKELKDTVDALDASSEQAIALRWLLGRRLVRDGDLAGAAAYFKPSEQKILALYTDALAKAKNPAIPKIERARAWFEAGWWARFDGMELMGSEVSPDGFVTGGDFPDPDIAKQRLSGVYETEAWVDNQYRTEKTPMVLKPNAEEIRRLEKNRIRPDLRFHYRTIAATHALEAAKLLDDNTPELADVLNSAGQWVKTSDEKTANNLYTLLKKRCSRTLLGQAALAKHWFVNQQGPWSSTLQSTRDALHKELEP